MKNSRLRARTRIAVLTLLVIVPSPVLANAGTGILIPGFLHLLFANLIIGIVETLFVKWTFKVRPHYGYIVLGNYVSTFIGYVMVGIAARFLGVDLLEPEELNIVLAVLFAVSVVAEWPFFAWQASGTMKALSWATFKQTFFAQCVSYTLLIPFYVVLTAGMNAPAPLYAMLPEKAAEIADDAYRYRTRAASNGEVIGSFEGFPTFRDDEDVLWSMAIARDSIVLEGRSRGVDSTKISAVIGTVGDLRSRVYSVNPKYFSEIGDLADEARDLAGLARDYRNHEAGAGGYAGFAISPGRANSAMFSWFALAAEDSILFTASSRKTSDVMGSVVLTRAGDLRNWKWMGRIANETARRRPYACFTRELHEVAAEACRYRGRTRSHGGAAGYSGYVPSVKAKYGWYELTVTSDSVVIRGTTDDTHRTKVSAVLDRRGDLHSWEYDVDPDTFLPIESDASHLRAFARQAYDYRHHKRTAEGGKASYAGFAPAQDPSHKGPGPYEWSVTPDSIFIWILNAERTQVMGSVELDSSGALHRWKWLREVDK